MTEQELLEIERLAVDQDRLFDPSVVIGLLAEVRRLRCCGNCKHYRARSITAICLNQDSQRYYADLLGNSKCDKWEAAGNG
ncbi:MAG: hypothetical protein AB9917_02110 [Negativicutes bacterium]